MFTRLASDTGEAKVPAGDWLVGLLKLPPLLASPVGLFCVLLLGLELGLLAALQLDMTFETVTKAPTSLDSVELHQTHRGSQVLVILEGAWI